MITCGNYITKAKAEEVLERVQQIYPEAGIRLETLGSSRHQVVAGRYKGKTTEAQQIAKDIEKLTGIATEAWSW